MRDWLQSDDIDIAVLYDPLHISALRAAPLTDPSPARRLVLSLANERPPTRAMRAAADTIVQTAHELMENKVWHARINRDLSTSGHRLSP